MAYNLGHFMRALPDGDRTVVATSLHEKLIKSSHRRHVTFQMSDAARQIFVEPCC